MENIYIYKDKDKKWKIAESKNSKPIKSFSTKKAALAFANKLERKSSTSENENILEVKNLRKVFTNSGKMNIATNNVSFTLKRGETLGLIGESGSGKTTIGRTIIRLHKPTSGSVFVNGINVATRSISSNAEKVLRNNVQMIFQDPYDSLNDQKNIMYIVSEPLKVLGIDKKMTEERYKNYSDVQKYFSESLSFKFIDTVNEFRTYSNTEALKMQKAIQRRLSAFKHLHDNKQDNIKELLSIFYDDKELSNKKVVDKILSINPELFNYWEQKQNDFENGKFLFKTEGKMKELEAKIRYQKRIVKHSREYVETEDEYKAAKKVLTDYRSFEKEELRVQRKVYSSTRGEWKINTEIKRQRRDLSTSQQDFDLLDFEFQLSKLIHSMTSAYKGLSIYDGFSEALNRVYEKNSTMSSIDQEFISSEMEKELSETIAISSRVDEYIFKEFKKDYITSYNTLEELVSNIEDIKTKLATINKKSAPIELDKLRELEVRLEEVKEEQVVEYDEWDQKNQAPIQKRHKEEAQENDRLTIELKESINVSKELFEAKIAEVLELDIPNFDRSINETMNTKDLMSWYKQQSKIKREADEYHHHEIKRIFKDVMLVKRFFMKKPLPKSKIRNLIVRNKVFSALEECGLTKSHAFRYPSEFSGGMRQRVGIARAIISDPKIIIADEPIAALDLSIQAQIVNMLKELQVKRNLSMIFIAHDLSMVKYISDRLAIIHLGRIVEMGTSSEIFDNPVHPYTRNLIASMPDIEKIADGFKSSLFEPDYLRKYSIKNEPSYNYINGEHYVLADKEQITKWKKETKTK